MGVTFTGRSVPLPKMPPVVPEEVKSVAAAAAKKDREEEAKAKASENNFNPDWLRLALAAGGGLIGHSLVSSLFDGKTDEEKRRESIWKKLLSAIMPIGAAGLGAWGGYALGGQLKNAADNNNGQNGADEPMGTEVILDGKSYGIHPDLTNTIVNLERGYVPGIGSRQVSFINERGQRELAKENMGEWGFWGADWLSSLGAAGAAGWGAKHGVQKINELVGDHGANKILSDANEIAKTQKELDSHVAASEAAQKVISGQTKIPKGLDPAEVRAANESIKRYSDNAATGARLKISNLERGVKPVSLARAKGIQEGVQAVAKTRKMGHGAKSLLGFGGAGLLAGLGLYTGKKEKDAIAEQARIRSALDQLAAQSNAVPASVQAPVQ